MHSDICFEGGLKNHSHLSVFL